MDKRLKVFWFSFFAHNFAIVGGKAGPKTPFPKGIGGGRSSKKTIPQRGIFSSPRAGGKEMFHMKHKFFVIVIVLAAAVALAACSGQSAPAATPTPNALATQVAALEVQQATQMALLEVLAATPTQGPTATPAQAGATQTQTAAPTLGQAVIETLAPSPTGTATPVAVSENHQPGDPGACPVDPSVKLVWPGYNSPADLNRLSAGTEWVSVCFPNGGGILASYIQLADGKTYDDVLRCDRDGKPQEVCGYLLNVPPGMIVSYHDGVGGTLYPDPGGEMYGADGLTLHPWLRDITAEVFPLPADN